MKMLKISSIIIIFFQLVMQYNQLKLTKMLYNGLEKGVCPADIGP